MTVNITIPNITNLQQAALFLNTATDNYFWIIILAAIWIISFIVFNRYSTPKAVLASSFITSLLCALLFFADLVGQQPLIGFFALLVLSIIAVYFFE